MVGTRSAVAAEDDRYAEGARADALIKHSHWMLGTIRFNSQLHSKEIVMKLHI